MTPASAAIIDARELPAARANIVDWVHEAGNPYWDWVFGGPQPGRAVLWSWLERPTSELSVTRASLLCEGDNVLGGFIALSGTELSQCRRADAVAIARDFAVTERKGLLARLAATRGLFPEVAPDDFYLSRLGVLPAFRGRGFGRQLLDAFMLAARRRGHPRLRLDVSASNTSALALYESAGFSCITRQSSAEAGMTYVSMARCQR